MFQIGQKLLCIKASSNVLVGEVVTVTKTRPNPQWCTIQVDNVDWWCCDECFKPHSDIRKRKTNAEI